MTTRNTQNDTPLSEYISRSSKGDTEAFRQLFDHITPDIFAFVASRTAHRDDAKDLTQDVVIDIWRALASFSYKSDKQFWSFVYTITRRKLATYYDKASPTTELHENIPNADTPGHDVVVRLQIMKLLDQLPKKLRIVMELRYCADLSFAMIADRLGEKEGTVKVRHHRALRKLSTLSQTI